MQSDQFSNKASEPVPADPQKADSTSGLAAANKQPSSEGSLGDRLSKLESRVQELELALASHAAPTLGKLHDNHGILASWFNGVKGLFIDHIGLRTIPEAPTEPPAK